MNQRTVDLTVVLPTVNRPPLLARALGSCFAGSVVPHEVVVVHDDPEHFDEYERVYELFQKRPVVRLVHSHRQGPSAARNTGWRAASSRWIYFLDDDDYLLPQGVETIDQKLEYTSDRSIVAFGSRVRRHGRSSVELPGAVIRRYGVPFWAELGTLVIPKYCLEDAGGFDPQIRIAENRDLMVRLAASFVVEHVDEPIVCLDYEHSNPRQSESEGTLEANIHLLRKNEGIYRSHPLWWRSAHLYPACHAARHGKLGTSVRLYREWATSSCQLLDARFLGAIMVSALSRLRKLMTR